MYKEGDRIVCWEDGSHGTIVSLVAHDCSGEPFLWSIRDDDGEYWLGFDGDFYLEEEGYVP